MLFYNCISYLAEWRKWVRIDTDIDTDADTDFVHSKSESSWRDQCYEMSTSVPVFYCMITFKENSLHELPICYET